MGMWQGSPSLHLLDFDGSSVLYICPNEAILFWFTILIGVGGTSKGFYLSMPAIMTLTSQARETGQGICQLKSISLIHSEITTGWVQNDYLLLKLDSLFFLMTGTVLTIAIGDLQCPCIISLPWMVVESITCLWAIEYGKGDKIPLPCFIAKEKGFYRCNDGP